MLDGGEFRLRLQVILLGQALDLLDIEHGVAFQEVDLALHVFPGIILGLCDGVGISEIIAIRLLPAPPARIAERRDPRQPSLPRVCIFTSSPHHQSTVVFGAILGLAQTERERCWNRRSTDSSLPAH